MSSSLRIALFTFLAVAVVGSVFAVRTLSRAGELTTLRPIFDGACVRVGGVVGVEDFGWDPERGRVYAVGEDRRAMTAGEATRGAIWALSFPDDALEPVDVTPAEPADFHPLGADLHVDAEGVRRLFVVNRADAGHRLEVFRVAADGGLAHERTFDDPLLFNANNVVALGPERAYVSIDKTSPTGSLGEIVEGALERRTGKIARVGPEGVEIVAEGLVYANGLALIDEGAGVAVAETVGRAVTFYDRDLDTDALTRRERVFLGTGLDNIIADPAGRLFIASHPKMLTYALGHAKDANQTSPSQVILVDPAAQQLDQVYLSLGEDLSASAAAVVDVEARAMLIGSIFEPFILSCTLPEVWRHSVSHPARRPQGPGG